MKILVNRVVNWLHNLLLHHNHHLHHLSPFCVCWVCVCVLVSAWIGGVANCASISISPTQACASHFIVLFKAFLFLKPKFKDFWRYGSLYLPLLFILFISLEFQRCQIDLIRFHSAPLLHALFIWFIQFYSFSHLHFLWMTIFSPF